MNLSRFLNQITQPEVPTPAGWNSMKDAPRNCKHVQVILRDGTIHKDAHFASDLSGEDQPPFEGWFIACGKPEYGFRGIDDPIGWKPK